MIYRRLWSLLSLIGAVFPDLTRSLSNDAFLLRIIYRMRQLSVPCCQQHILPMQCQICRDGRCFCLDPFPQDLHEQLIACLWLCRGPLFGIDGLPDILQWQIADVSRCELDKSGIDIFDDVLNSSDINIARATVSDDFFS